MFGADSLVLCAGTLPRATPFRTRLEAASRAGFHAISLWGRDYQAARDEGWSDPDLGTMLDDHGLTVAELDPAWWWTPGATDVHIPPELDPVDVFRFREDDLLRIADVVRARSLNAADVVGGSWSVEEAAEAFAALCDRAAEHGLLVHLEWLAWSRIPDLATAWDIVRLAGRANGGINVDFWHCGRTGVKPEDLRAIPGERILAIQAADGPAEPESNLIEETLHRRLLPGHGSFDVGGYLAVLRSSGTAAPLGIEVFSDALHGAGPLEAAQRAADSMRSLLSR